MTKKEILEMTGLSEEEFYQQYPTQEAWTESYKKGGWIQKATASIKRRGTEGVCTGSNFGGPSCRPGTKRYNLAKTFRKMAKSRKEDGGIVDMYEDGNEVIIQNPNKSYTYYTKTNTSDGPRYYEGNSPSMALAQTIANFKKNNTPADSTVHSTLPFNVQEKLKKAHGGIVDVYQLMGMPTPSMYGMGGPTHYTPSYNFGHVQSKNTTYNHGFGYGGMVPAYGKGGFLNDVWTGVKDVGIAAADNTLSVVNPDIIKESAYSDTGFGDAMKGYSSTMGTFINKAAPAAANILLPGVGGMAVSAAQNIGGNFVESDPERMKRDSVKIAGSLGQLGSMATSFMNPIGAAGSIGNTVGGGSNIATATGGMPMFAAMGGPVYNPFLTPQMQLAQRSAINKQKTMMAAMGGAVNAPNMMQYADGGLLGNMPIFADGGNTQMIEGELEHGENLNVFRNGRWETVTKYESGGMERHNADGTPNTNNNVFLPVGGSIASRKYKKEDDLAEATNDTLHKEALHGKVITAKSGGYVRGSYANGGPVNGELRFPGRIEWTKMKKEAKEQQLAAMQEQKASKAMNRMMAKYGGAIQRMYAKGGLIPMYDGGSNVTGPRADSGFYFNKDWAPLGPQAYEGTTSAPFNILGNNLSQTITPSMSYPPAYGPNMTNPNSVEWNTSRQGVDPQGNAVSINPSASRYYQVPGMNTGDIYGSTWDQSPNYSPKFSPEQTEDFSNSDLGNALQYAPVAWNAIQAMKRRTKVPNFAMDTNLVAPQVTDREGERKIIEMANLGKYNARQVGGSGILPALTNLATNRMKTMADYRENLDTKNAMLGYDAATKRKGYEQFNVDAAMKKYMLQAQADAVPTQYASAAAEGLGKIGDTRKQDAMTKYYIDKMYPYLNKTQV
jgi:hypothetical protein